MAVEQDESSIVSTFGAAALLDVVVGLQAECDSQGLRMLQRFMEARRVAQLVNVSGWMGAWQAGCYRVQGLLLSVVLHLCSRMRLVVAEHTAGMV